MNQNDVMSDVTWTEVAEDVCSYEWDYISDRNERDLLNSGMFRAMQAAYFEGAARRDVHFVWENGEPLFINTMGKREKPWNFSWLDRSGMCKYYADVVEAAPAGFASFTANKRRTQLRLTEFGTLLTHNLLLELLEERHKKDAHLMAYRDSGIRFLPIRNQTSDRPDRDAEFWILQAKYLQEVANTYLSRAQSALTRVTKNEEYVVARLGYEESTAGLPPPSTIDK